MTVINDVVALVILLLPAILLLGLMTATVIPRFSKSWREAEARADLLVRSVLTPEEYEKLYKRGFLDIPSPSIPHRTYRVPSGTGTVSVLERGRCVDRLCVHAATSIPEREEVLVHKLMIEGNEQDYLRRANHLPC